MRKANSRYFLYIFFLLNSFTFLSFSQKDFTELIQFSESASIKDILEKNSALLLENLHEESLILSNKLIELYPENSNFNYRKGLSLLMIGDDLNAAKKHLELATKSTSNTFDFFSSKEMSSPVDSYFYLGKCLHLLTDIINANKNLQAFLEKSNPNNLLRQEASLLIEQCKIATRELMYPKNYEIVNLGKKINTSDPEYSSVVSLDGQSLYFTSRRLRKDNTNINIYDLETGQYLEDIYVVYKNGLTDWSDPVLLDFCQPDLNEATIGISTDERNIYVYNDAIGNGDIYFSEFQDGKFKNIEPLPDKSVNSASWEPHITVSHDGNSKYFSSDRDGGLGGRDIYRIVKLPNGEWSEPFNLGAPINTSYDEDSPFISADDKTLYFSSNGPQSMGGFDIFLSIQLEDTWSSPINLGYPLNSTGDDIYYTTTADGVTGYISSSRQGGMGNKDIYEVKNEVLGSQNVSFLEGTIEIIPSNNPIPEDIEIIIDCKNCDARNIRTVSPRLRDGKFFSTLPKCSEFDIIYTRKNGSEELYRMTLNTNCEDNFEKLEKSVIYDSKNHTIREQMPFSYAGLILDQNSSDKIDGAQVDFIDLAGNIFAIAQSSFSGKFNSKILEDKKYGDLIDFYIRISKENYVTRQFLVSKHLGDDNIIIDTFKIDQLHVGEDLSALIEINPIYFDLDQYSIRPDAAIELDKIVQIMNDNPNLKIELGSHTDCRGDYSYNMSLSDNRARASANYIKQKISNPERIYGKGYGESKLLNDCACEGGNDSNCSDEQHQKNRRTEFRIIE